MSELPPERMEEHLPGYEPDAGGLGVMDAVRMGWQLLMSDFWPIWVLGLVVAAVLGGIGGALGVFMIIPIVNLLGACLMIVVGLFVQPPFLAGLFYAVGRVIDGQKAEAGQVFEGFRQRYWPSVVAVLLPMGIGFGIALVFGGIAGVLIAATGADEDEEALAAITLLVGLPMYLILFLVGLLFIFSLVAVWDHPESGWEAMKTSVRVVKEHYLSTLGFALLFALITVAAEIVGLLACCVGVLFTMPVVMVWSAVSMVYLYRSWTGQPLTQPLADGPAGESPPPPPAPGAGTDAYPGGPVPPSDIEMPPT